MGLRYAGRGRGNTGRSRERSPSDTPVSPAEPVGPTFSGITGYQGPTRWFEDVMPSEALCGVERWGSLRLDGEGRSPTPHNHARFRGDRSEARSLSGARKRPRRSASGSTASMASSFAVGSART